MKKAILASLCVLVSFFLFLALKNIFASHAKEILKESISYEDNYSNLFLKAQKEKKYVLLYFTTKNSSECVWCKKMEKKIFNSKEFQRKILDKFIAFRVDLTEANPKSLELKKRFDIEWLPTVVLLSEKEELIGKMGYLPISGKEYADNILEKIHDWRLLVDSHYETLSAHELKHFYQMADKQGFLELKERIFHTGVAKKNLYFLFEKYQELLFQSNWDEAKKIRIEIETLDPRNLHRMHLKLALLDFYIFSEGQKATNEVVSPLLNYLEQFGKKDRDNRWQLEALLSHFYFVRKENTKALDHARMAYKCAPLLMKKELNSRILELKSLEKKS